MKTKYLTLFLLFAAISAFAQNTYTVELSKGQPSILGKHLQLGSSKSPSGDVLDANSQGAFGRKK